MKGWTHRRIYSIDTRKQNKPNIKPRKKLNEVCQQNQEHDMRERRFANKL